MTLRTLAGIRTGEDADDLQSWLRQLQGCPPISRTHLTVCSNPVHGDERPSWFYVEADAAHAVARRRCLSCADERDVLDSADHWTAPHMWACPGCRQSIAEIAAGMHVDPETDQVTWIALGARCVACGMIQGLTDFTIEPRPVAEVIPQL